MQTTEVTPWWCRVEKICFQQYKSECCPIEAPNPPLATCLRTLSTVLLWCSVEFWLFTIQWKHSAFAHILCDWKKFTFLTFLSLTLFTAYWRVTWDDLVLQIAWCVQTRVLGTNKVRHVTSERIVYKCHKLIKSLVPQTSASFPSRLIIFTSCDHAGSRLCGVRMFAFLSYIFFVSNFSELHQCNAKRNRERPTVTLDCIVMNDYPLVVNA